MKNIIETLFTTDEILKLQKLYDDAIIDFNYEVEINPFACIDYFYITEFVNTKFENLSTSLASEITNEITNYLL